MRRWYDGMDSLLAMFKKELDVEFNTKVQQIVGELVKGNKDVTWFLLDKQNKTYIKEIKYVWDDSYNKELCQFVIENWVDHKLLSCTISCVTSDMFELVDFSINRRK